MAEQEQESSGSLKEHLKSDLLADLETPVEVDKNKVKAPKVWQDDITIVSHITHRRKNRPAESVDMRFSRKVTLSEEPYSRQTSVGEEWKELDTGWIKDRLGTLSIQNQAGLFQDTNPTPEEKADMAKQVLELSFSQKSEESWLVPPGEGFHGLPATSMLYLRSQHGTTNYELTAFPL